MAQPQKVSDLLSKAAAQENFDEFKEIELTEEEISKILYDARRKKYFDNKMSEYKKKLIQTEFAVITAEDLYRKVHAAGFKVDETNKILIWDLCRYFVGDPRGPLNLDKGIMLYGPIGCYKTSLMRFFRKNQHNSFVVVSSNDISSEFASNGEDAIMKYKQSIKVNPDEFFGKSEIGICIDDLGVEVDKKHYGNESNVIASIILSRFMNETIEKNKTHITTNINVQTIEERYGARVRSRLREMVNLVEFPDNSPDRRE